jgi:hypothetical protein
LIPLAAIALKSAGWNVFAFTQQRDQRQYWDHCDVLEQQNGKRGSAFASGQFASFRQRLQHEGSGRHGQCQSDDDGGRKGEAEADTNGSEQRGRDNYLCRAKPENRPAQYPQARRLQLEANDKQQHHDSQFGEMHNALDLADDAEARWANDDTGRQISEHGAHFEVSKKRHEDNSCCKKNSGLREKAHN